MIENKGGNMRILSRPLNKGETFCCSMRAAKELFRNYDITLNFSYLGRDFGTFAETPDRYYVERNVKGRIVSSLYMYTNQARPILSFYVLKEENYSPELRTQYEKEFLPEHLRMYKELTKNPEAKKIDDKIMLVTLKDGKFNLYETTLRTYYKD